MKEQIIKLAIIISIYTYIAMRVIDKCIYEIITIIKSIIPN